MIMNVYPTYFCKIPETMKRSGKGVSTKVNKMFNQNCEQSLAFSAPFSNPILSFLKPLREPFVHLSLRTAGSYSMAGWKLPSLPLSFPALLRASWLWLPLLLFPPPPSQCLVLRDSTFVFLPVVLLSVTVRAYFSHLLISICSSSWFPNRLFHVLFTFTVYNMRNVRKCMRATQFSYFGSRVTN